MSPFVEVHTNCVMPSTITTREPCLQDLSNRGFIQGATIKHNGKPICNYFGGIPYAQPPVGEHRWRRPRELAPCYSYGSRTSPGIFDGKAAVCPQPITTKEDATENCLELNIWVPSGAFPEGGWPIYFYIHGGFLQFGSPNLGDPIDLLSLPTNRFIIVKPTYRLNLFGFLGGKDILKASGCGGNFGFWDIRIALEWTYKLVSYFDGNPSAITVGGYSAGSHAAFHQLAFDVRQPKHIIKRVIMQSNGPGLQPKSLAETQKQFDELCNILSVPTTLSSTEKLDRLRGFSPSKLLVALKSMKISQFRAVSDDQFVSSSLIPSLRSGKFAALCRKRNISILLGENSNEHFVYALWRPPKPATKESVATRLEADYPARAVNTLMKMTRKDPETSWAVQFGKLYAEVQVHASQRGLVQALSDGGVEFLRYRIDWRAKCADRIYKKKWGATHGADNYLWWYGDGDVEGLSDEEKNLVRGAFLDDFRRFIYGQRVDWGLKDPRDVRLLQANGEVKIWQDKLWNKGLETWDAVAKASQITDRPKI